MADEAGGAGPSEDAVIDAIIGVEPGYQPGTRPIHAPGIALTGRFQASEVASGLTDAEHFSGRTIPVTVRFSNGTGSPKAKDSDFLVRGMAVKFHMGEVGPDEHGVVRGTREADMVAMTLPVFFADTLDAFMEFLAVDRSAPVPKATLGRKVADALHLRPPPSRPLTSADLAAVAYANSHPEARNAIVGLAALARPQSYVTCAYHAVHAFLLTAGDQVTAVRFRWEPVAGVRPAATPVKPEYLREELAGRLRKGPADFVLRIQVAEQGDDTSDPTTPWPERRRRVVMGLLRLDQVVDDQVHGNERLDFNPTRLVPGVALSDDPILRARQTVYQRSAERRLEARPG